MSNVIHKVPIGSGAVVSIKYSNRRVTACPDPNVRKSLGWIIGKRDKEILVVEGGVDECLGPDRGA